MVPIVGVVLAMGLAGCPGREDADAGDARDGGGNEAGDVQQMDRVVPDDVEQPDVQGTDATDSGDVVGDVVTPDPMPSMVTRVVDCGTTCRRPLDAVLTADGSTVFFTAFTPDNQAAVFRVAATGGAIMTVSMGGALDFPVGLAISDDNATLYIADLSADGASVASGAVFSLPAAGGAVTRLDTGAELVAPSGIAVDGASLVVSAQRSMGGMQTPAVFRVASTGMATPIAMGGGLEDPTDVAVGAAGTYYTFDTGRGDATGRVGIITATIGFGASGLVASYPAGIAASRDGNSLLVAGWAPGEMTRLSFVAAAGGAPTAIASADLRSPTGLGRARNAAIYVVADELAGPTPTAAGNGAIFLVR